VIAFLFATKLIGVLAFELDDDTKFDQKIQRAVKAHRRELGDTLFVEFSQNLIGALRFFQMAQRYQNITSNIGHAFAARICHLLDGINQMRAVDFVVVAVFGVAQQTFPSI